MVINIIQGIKSRRVKWREMYHVWGRGEVHTRFWWGKLRERDYLKNTSIVRRIILKWIFRKIV
jgi:hypothetical protein